MIEYIAAGASVGLLVAFILWFFFVSAVSKSVAFEVLLYTAVGAAVGYLCWFFNGSAA